MIGLDVLVVGLTGQTGAGKSTVSKVFCENGFAVINADLISRKVVEKGTKCLDELTEVFSNKILNEDGTLNRKMLGNMVFSDKTKLEMLNSVIYPYITSEILQEIKGYSDGGKKLVLLDAPTLFESHADDFCEIIISVLADEEIREIRIINRDGLTKKQAQDRMNSQLSAEFFASNSDFVIENNETLDALSSISREVSDKIKYYYNHIRTVESSVL